MLTVSIHPYPSMPDEVVAFSTTRHGGCSEGSYASFNCTPYVGDDTAVVQANQTMLCERLGITADRLVIPYQTHSCNLLTIDDTFMHLSGDARHAMLQEKDAMMTSLDNTCLCISTADCIPILLYDPIHRAIAAIHAGWRGTVNGIVTSTIQTMHQTYGTQGADVHAVIGPGISLAAFEVGIEVYEAFEEAGYDMGIIARWHPEKEKFHIDLPKANQLALRSNGVPAEQIHDCGICTYTQHRDFFSARRLSIKSGRILSGIMLR